MRILMTTDTVGGGWTRVIALASALSKWSIDVDLVASGPAMTHEQRREADGVPRLKTHERECRIEGSDDTREEIKASAYAIRRIAAATSPDLLHFNTYAPASERWDAPVLLEAHSCIGSWWNAVYGGDPPSQFDGRQRMTRRALSEADVLAAPTAAHAAAANARHKIDRKWKIIPPGGGDGCAVRTKKMIAMTAGRLCDEAKNVRLFVEASSFIDYPTFAAGPGPPADDPGDVQWLGRISRSSLLDRLSECAVYVHPVRYEPFGQCPLEAAASGCALVLSDIPSLRELWDGAAEFVSTDDAGELAATVNGILSDQSRRRVLSEAALRRARRYSLHRMARHYRAQYWTMLSSSHQGQRIA